MEFAILVVNHDNIDTNEERERERENCCERRLIYRCSRRSGRRSAEGREARLFADVMVATASRSSGSPRGRGRFANRGSPQPRDPLKNESGRVLRVFVTLEEQKLPPRVLLCSYIISIRVHPINLSLVSRIIHRYFDSRETVRFARLSALSASFSQ